MGLPSSGGAASGGALRPVAVSARWAPVAAAPPVARVVPQSRTPMRLSENIILINENNNLKAGRPPAHGACPFLVLRNAGARWWTGGGGRGGVPGAVARGGGQVPGPSQAVPTT